MLKRLLLSGAALTALATYAVAQAPAPADTAAPSAMENPAATSSPAMGTEAPAAAEAKADPNLYSNITGADVIGQGDESLGSVADLLIDANGQLQSVVIAHGGIIGIGQTYRQHQISELPPIEDGKLRLGDLTTAALEGLPEYEYPESGETGRASTSGAPADAGSAATNAGSAGVAADGTSAGGASMKAQDQTAAAGGNDAAASSSAMSGNTGMGGADASATASGAGSLWPVSKIVGAAVGAEEDKATVSDLRMEGGKVAAVLIDRGSLGLGNKVQEVAFEELSISGTPAEPQIALKSGGGAASAPSAEGSMTPGASAPAETAPATAPAAQ